MSMLWMWFQFRFYVINKAEQIALFQNPLHISCCLSLMASNSPHKLLSLLIISFGEHIVEGGGVKGRKMIILSHKYSRKLSEPKKNLTRSLFFCVSRFIQHFSLRIWKRCCFFFVCHYLGQDHQTELENRFCCFLFLFLAISERGGSSFNGYARETYQKINKALFFRSYFCATFIGNCSEMYKKKILQNRELKKCWNELKNQWNHYVWASALYSAGVCNFNAIVAVGLSSRLFSFCSQ